MSFLSYRDIIEEGDTVILYINVNCMHAIKVVTKILNKHGNSIDNVFQTIYGALNVPSLIGKKFGTKIELTRGWAYVLHPTPELWTLTLPHRTQIIYTPDISMIIHQLEIKPGSIVLEAGTGSGSLTHAIARVVNPSGWIHTFDFHEQRVSIAQEEFINHGISNIRVMQRDICSDGFGEELSGRADAIFLDLPHPWLAVSHAVNAFKTCGGRFCSFSPCIEQVQKTCNALREFKFMEITTLECLQREISVNSKTIPDLTLSQDEEGKKKRTFLSGTYNVTMPGHTGYLTCATLPPAWVRGLENDSETVDEIKEETISSKTEDKPGTSSNVEEIEN